MAPGANWKGVISIGDIICPVALYTAALTSERIAFHVLNRKTGHRVHPEFVDSETDERVELPEDQVKGYETGRGDYITFEPDEIAEAIPDSNKTLDIQAFIPRDQVDDVYFDRPYYLAPSTPAGGRHFALIRDGMAAAHVVAIARTVLFRRVRSVLIRGHDKGMIANTLNFDYEIRSSDEAFSELPAVRVDAEMLDLALHIIETKSGRFDPEKFDDRYEAALLELVKAKMEGRKIELPRVPEPTKPSDLMEALRQSAKGGSIVRSAKTKAPSRSSTRRPKAA
jgi:DNA end-binding protein Ku